MDNNKENPDQTVLEMAIHLSYLVKTVEEIKVDVTSIKNELENNYMTKESFDIFKTTEFTVIQKLLYGFIALVLVAVSTGILNLVVSNQ